MDSIEVLDMNDDNFGGKLAKALNLKPLDKVTISTPVFERQDEIKVDPPVKTVLYFDDLHNMTEDYLKSIGCQIWEIDKASKTIHWLYPAEWYDYIPENYLVTDICGRDKEFKHGVTDNDRRFGALSYGFIQKVG